MVTDATDFMVSEEEGITLGPKTISVTPSFVYILFKVKVTEKASDTDIRRGVVSAPLISFSKGVIYLITVKSLTRPSPTGLELTIERS